MNHGRLNRSQLALFFPEGQCQTGLGETGRENVLGKETSPSALSLKVREGA